MADESVESVLARLSAFLAGHDHAEACHFWRQDGTEETCDCGLRTARQDVDRLALAHARAAQDAGRYRWLRENASASAWNADDFALVGVRVPKARGTCWIDKNPKVLDAAIDAAIAARQQEGSP